MLTRTSRKKIGFVSGLSDSTPVPSAGIAPHRHWHALPCEIWWQTLPWAIFPGPYTLTPDRRPQAAHAVKPRRLPVKARCGTGARNPLRIRGLPCASPASSRTAGFFVGPAPHKDNDHNGSQPRTQGRTGCPVHGSGDRLRRPGLHRLSGNQRPRDAKYSAPHAGCRSHLHGGPEPAAAHRPQHLPPRCRGAGLHRFQGRGLQRRGHWPHGDGTKVPHCPGVEDPRSAVRQPRFVKDSGVFCWPCATQGQRPQWLSAAHARKNWLPSTRIW